GVLGHPAGGEGPHVDLPAAQRQPVRRLRRRAPRAGSAGDAAPAAQGAVSVGGARDVGLPSVHRSGRLPERVTIWEVGPRDGLQNEKSTVAVDVKLEFVQRLADAGLTTIETTSFVHPKWVPQLADAEQLLERLERRAGVRYPVLVPNERGLERALAAGVEDIAVFASATE